jgi:hypothetical protein
MTPLDRLIPLLTEAGLSLLTEAGDVIGIERLREQAGGGRRLKRGKPFTVPVDLVFPVDRPAISQQDKNVPILMMLGVM